MTIGKTLLNKRVEKGLSIKELSQKSGLSAVTIINYEKGRYKPTALSLNKLATVLGCDFEELYKLIEEN